MVHDPEAGLTGRLAPAQQLEICLDGRNQALPDGTGVLSYARTLAAGLASLGRRADILLDGRREPLAVERLSAYARAVAPCAAWASKAPSAPIGFGNALIAQDVFRSAQIHFSLYGRLRRVRAGRPPRIMHWTYPLPLMFCGTVNIYTIHDLIPLTHSSLTTIERVRFERIVRQVVQKADHIVTVSENSKRDIMSLLDVSEDRVTNTYQPVSLDLPNWMRARRPPYAYLLFCGTIEARKNIPRLIAAYQASGVDMPLILAGPDGNGSERLHPSDGGEVRPFRTMPIGGCRGVWRAPWLERPALLDLLAGAQALVFPSLAEGFGLPIVEAMALGVPVLTSNGGATGEIAGEAALLVDPLDVADMAAGISALARDSELRRDLGARGYRRAERFTADACLQRLDDVYRKFGDGVR